jgi:hypothetical protein
VRFLLSILVSFLLISSVSAQTDTVSAKNDTLQGNYYRLHEVERNGIKLPEINIKEVLIVGRAQTSQKMSYSRYERLIYNLKKVYPYSLIVRSRLASVNEELKKIPDDRGRRKYLRQVEKDVFGEYEDDVRDMTITQGKLLIKLIDRETANTSYDLIREYRGTFSAAFWQSIARIFGTNLKDKYDPEGDDALIELLLHQIEIGNI